MMLLRKLADHGQAILATSASVLFFFQLCVRLTYLTGLVQSISRPLSSSKSSTASSSSRREESAFTVRFLLRHLS
jgi:hypothetical protein